MHGLAKTYKHKGCRCSACTTAHNIYQAELRQRQKNSKETEPTFYKIPDATKYRCGVGTETTATNINATWRRSAACVGHDPAMWDIDNPQQWEQAATICSTCPVRQDCATDNFGNLDAFGMYCGIPLWAGTPMEQKT